VIHFIALNPVIVDTCGHRGLILICIYYKCYITVFDKVLSIHLWCFFIFWGYLFTSKSTIFSM